MRHAYSLKMTSKLPTQAEQVTHVYSTHTKATIPRQTVIAYCTVLAAAQKLMTLTTSDMLPASPARS